MAYGPILAEWARIMLLASTSKQGGMALPLYNYLESQDLLACHLGIRAGEVSLYINKQGPCLSAITSAPSYHPDNYQTLHTRREWGCDCCHHSPPAPVLQHVIITSGDETTLLTILIYAEFDPDSNVLSALSFLEPTEAYKCVSKLTTKDECVLALKNMMDTNNVFRVPGSEHNMLIMSRDYDDVDTVIPTAIITGIYVKTEIKGMKSASAQFTLIHFRAWKGNRDRPPQRTLGLSA